MITRLIVLLLLVTQITCLYQHQIDLKRCETEETVCYVRESCVESKTETSRLFPYKDQKLNNGDCDVIVQFKTLNKIKFHMMIQVKNQDTSKKLKIEDGVKLVQKETQFHCKKDSFKGNSKFNIAELGAQKFENDIIFCSFTATHTDPSVPIVIPFYKYVDNSPSVQYTTDKGNVIVDSQQLGYNFWLKVGDDKCNHDFMTTLEKETEKDAMTKVEDLTLSMLSCPFSFLLKIGKEEVTTTSVHCKKDGSKWKWHYKKDDADIAVNGNFDVSCKDKKCRVCAAPDEFNCDNCTPALFTKPPTDDSCGSLTCPGASDFTVDGSDVLKGTAECKKRKDEGFGWFLKETELNPVGCLEKKNCTVPDLMPCKKDDATCANIIGHGNLECEKKIDEKERRQIGYITDGKQHNTSYLKCNTTTGLYTPAEANHSLAISQVFCISPEASSPSTGAQSAGLPTEAIIFIVSIVVLLVTVGALIYVWFCYKKKRTKGVNEATKTVETTNKSSSAQSEGDDKDQRSKIESKRSKKSSRSKRSKKSDREKVKLKDYDVWDDIMFNKKILPFFNTAKAESKIRWLRDRFTRFYNYSTLPNVCESGTIEQYWKLVKQCRDDKCVDGPVWRELFRVAVLINFICPDKSPSCDSLHSKVLEPFESYMARYIKKKGINKKKGENREISEMRMVAMEILLHCNNKELIADLKKLEYTDDLEVPLRKILSACLCRETGDTFKIVDDEYARYLDLNGKFPDAHSSEGWGGYHQHCIFGMTNARIGKTKPEQADLFEALYEAENPSPRKPDEKKFFTPLDWLYAYQGAFLHPDTTKFAIKMFRKYNLQSFTHIEILLKEKCEDMNARTKLRATFQQAMKEYTMLMADMVVGAEEYKEFKPHLEPVIVFIGDIGKKDEAFNEEKVCEKATTMGRMLLDKAFVKDCVESIDSTFSTQ